MVDFKDKNERKTIQSVERAAMIMDCLSKGPRSLADLSRELNLHKSTVHGLLQALLKYAYVQQDEATGHYRLGYRLLALGSAFLEQCDLREAAAPYLRKLVDEHGETVHLVIMNDGQVVYLDKIDSPQSIRMVSRIGRHLPTHCTGVGKAILAFLPPEKVRVIIDKRGLPRYTNNTITTWSELAEELARIRQQGVAYDREEIEVGLRCVAVPIIGFGSYPVGAISISGPAWRMTEDRVEKMADSLRRVSQELSRQMGENEGIGSLTVYR